MLNPAVEITSPWLCCAGAGAVFPLALLTPAPGYTSVGQVVSLSPWGFEPQSNPQLCVT